METKKKTRRWFLCVGDDVNFHSIIGGPVTSSNHKIKDIFISEANETVAFISGKSGYVSIEALSPMLRGQQPLGL